MFVSASLAALNGKALRLSQMPPDGRELHDASGLQVVLFQASIAPTSA